MKAYWDNSDLVGKKEEPVKNKKGRRRRSRKREKMESQDKLDKKEGLKVEGEIEELDSSFEREREEAGVSTDVGQPGGSKVEKKEESSMMEMMAKMFEKLGNSMEDMKVEMKENNEKLEGMKVEMKESSERLENSMKDNINKLEKKIDYNNKRFEDTSREIRQEMKISNSTLENKLRVEMKESIKETEIKVEGRVVNIEKEIVEIIGDKKKYQGELEWKMLNSHERQKAKVENEIKRMNDKLDEWQGESAQEISAVKERMKKVEGEIINRRVRFGTEGGTSVIYVGGNEQSVPKFTPNKNYHPKTFIKDLKSYLDGLQTQMGSCCDQVMEVNTIKLAMKGEAEMWFNTIKHEINNLEEFEAKFLKFYWGPDQQVQLQTKLFNGKYIQNRNLTRENYAIDKLHSFQQLEGICNMTTIIRQLAQHFNFEIYRKVIIDNIIEFDQFIQILRGYDYAEEEEKRAGGRHNVNFGNYNNNNNERNGNFQRNNNSNYGNRYNNNNNNYNNNNHNNNGRYGRYNNNYNNNNYNNNYNNYRPNNNYNRDEQYLTTKENIKHVKEHPPDPRTFN